MPPRLRAHDTYSRGAPTTARRRRVGLDYSSGRRLQQRAWRAHALVQGDSDESLLRLAEGLYRLARRARQSPPTRPI